MSLSIDESAQNLFVSHMENFSTQSVIHLLNALETISKSSSDEEDFVTFVIHLLFKVLTFFLCALFYYIQGVVIK